MLEDLLQNEAVNIVNEYLQRQKDIFIGGKSYCIQKVRIVGFSLADVDNKTAENGDVAFQAKIGYMEEIENGMGLVQKHAKVEGKVHIEKRYILGIVGKLAFFRADYI